MRTAYGFDDIRQNHSLIHIAERLILEFSEASVPGRYLVNYFPILKYVPSWFPGAGFQTRFKEIAQMSFKSLYPPFEEAKRDVVSALGSTILGIAQVVLVDSHVETLGGRKGR